MPLFLGNLDFHVGLLFPLRPSDPYTHGFFNRPCVFDHPWTGLVAQKCARITYPYTFVQLTYLVFYFILFYFFKRVFEKWWKLKLIKVFSLFLVLFMGLIALSGIIYESHCTIQLAFSFFFFFLQYFQQKVFSFVLPRILI